MTGTIEIFRGEGLQPWRFRLRSTNGEIISQSEGYLTKWNAKRGARKIAESLGVPLKDTTSKPYSEVPVSVREHGGAGAGAGCAERVRRRTLRPPSQ